MANNNLGSKLLATGLGKPRQLGGEEEILESKLLGAGLGKPRQVGHDNKS